MVVVAGTVTMVGKVTMPGAVTMAGAVTMVGAAVGGTAVGMFPPGTAGAGSIRVIPKRTGPTRTPVAIEPSALPRHMAHAGIASRFADNTNRKILHRV